MLPLWDHGPRLCPVLWQKFHFWGLWFGMMKQILLKPSLMLGFLHVVILRLNLKKKQSTSPESESAPPWMYGHLLQGLFKHFNIFQPIYLIPLFRQICGKKTSAKRSGPFSMQKVEKLLGAIPQTPLGDSTPYCSTPAPWSQRWFVESRWDTSMSCGFFGHRKREETSLCFGMVFFFIGGKIKASQRLAKFG